MAPIRWEFFSVGATSKTYREALKTAFVRLRIRKRAAPDRSHLDLQDHNPKKELTKVSSRGLSSAGLKEP